MTASPVRVPGRAASVTQSYVPAHATPTDVTLQTARRRKPRADSGPPGRVARRFHGRYPRTDGAGLRGRTGAGRGYFLRWRMRLRIRRFFRPTLRRPFPRRRLAMRSPRKPRLKPTWVV